MTLLAVLIISSSTFAGLRPSLLLCEVAVDRAVSVLGMRRRLADVFLSFDFRSRPVFWMSLGGKSKL